MSGVMQHFVGNVSFGPAHSLWEEQPSLRELYDQACASIVRAECEVEELRAEVAMKQEQAHILAEERNEAQEKAERYRLEANAMMAKLHELQAYADKLADGLPAGMLPRDVQNLREANAGLADDLQKAEQERDEARIQYRSTEALGMALAKTINEMKAERDELKAEVQSYRADACRESCQDKAAADRGWANI
jgi:uncharacterized coiled-coil DUF342 family protein